ncbi:aromatic-ring-hydroxylating dioxygenase subunit beta [Streptomyces albipurpureus]|uniref:Aromatic-ring-hydroxylating dioxygenase subunit beta n=1 Tax=Streptomyces albipurpureus TaxID=2897419 RepID=A0ABT0V092_9ACTN|nr:aromatic-ring-hydroxylating dioxygenase subunit beta [Streptomyces sp. CWNU-1]MCM2394141.1 aromatic-ring-hydroxylating dioxygenase subunit beta [Streptomyces sp. CWNU-1]
MTTTGNRGSVQCAGRTVTRQEVEDFLFAEADILDHWDYDGWLALFEPGARYEIPTTDYRPGWSLHETGSFVDDDWNLLLARVKRLKSRKAHAENPHSRTHRLVSNVRLSQDTEDSFRVAAAFVVHRARDGRFDAYVGWYEHLLVPTEDGLRFRLRRSVLGHESLAAGARLSFIL